MKMTTENLKTWVVFARILRSMAAIFAVIATPFSLGEVIVNNCITSRSLAESVSMYYGDTKQYALWIYAVLGCVSVSLTAVKFVRGKNAYIFGHRRTRRLANRLDQGRLPSDSIGSRRMLSTIYSTGAFALLSAAVLTIIMVLTEGSSLIIWYSTACTLLKAFFFATVVMTVAYLYLAKRQFAKLVHENRNDQLAVVLMAQSQ